MERKYFLRILTEKMGLYGESLSNLPLIEICGYDRILIENHCGVIAYNDRCVKVSMKYGAACITGVHLRLSHIQKDRILICGNLHSVTMERTV